MRQSSRETIRNAIIGAFTIATALIWKDVFTAAIEKLIPAQDQLELQTMAAILATILIIIALKVFLSTEEQAEEAIKDFSHMIDDTIKHRNHPHHHEHRK